MDISENSKVMVATNGETSGAHVITKKAAVWNVSADLKQRVRSWE